MSQIEILNRKRVICMLHSENKNISGYCSPSSFSSRQVTWIDSSPTCPLNSEKGTSVFDDGSNYVSNCIQFKNNITLTYPSVRFLYTNGIYLGGTPRHNQCESA